MAGNGSSYKAMAWAWDLELATPAEKLVLLNLAGRADQAYSCYPGLNHIARQTGLNRSTVTRALNALEAADVLMRATRKRKNGSTGSTRYFLCHPEAPHVTGDVDVNDDPGRFEELDRASERAILAHEKAVDNSAFIKPLPALNPGGGGA